MASGLQRDDVSTAPDRPVACVCIADEKADGQAGSVHEYEYDRHISIAPLRRRRSFQPLKYLVSLAVLQPLYASAQLLQKFGLDLADALARDAKSLACLLQRRTFSSIEPEPILEDDAFPRGEIGHQLLDDLGVRVPLC